MLTIPSLRDWRSVRDWKRTWRDPPGYVGPGYRRCKCCSAPSSVSGQCGCCSLGSPATLHATCTAFSSSGGGTLCPTLQGPVCTPVGLTLPMANAGTGCSYTSNVVTDNCHGLGGPRKINCSLNCIGGNWMFDFAFIDGCCSFGAQQSGTINAQSPNSGSTCAPISLTYTFTVPYANQPNLTGCSGTWTWNVTL